MKNIDEFPFKLQYITFNMGDYGHVHFKLEKYTYALETPYIRLH